MYDGYQPPTATARLLPNRATSRLIRANRDEESGRVAWEVPQAAQPTCVLCGLIGGDAHIVRGQVMHAHAPCVAALQKRVGLPDKPARKAAPMMSKAHGPMVRTDERPLLASNEEQARNKEAAYTVIQYIAQEIQAGRLPN